MRQPWGGRVPAPVIRLTAPECTQRNATSGTDTSYSRREDPLMSVDLPLTPKRICIIRLSAIGDCCHTVPVLRTLQATFPNAELTWVIGKVEATLIGDIPGVDFIVFDKSRGVSAYFDIRKALRKRSFDILLHMHASMRANLVSLMVSSPYRLGFDKVRARDRQWLFCNHFIPARDNQHVMDGLFEFARHIGATEPVLRWDIPLSTDDRNLAANYIPADKPTLLISPCSSQRFRNFRNWSVENYVELSDYAAQHYNMQVVLTGGNTDLEQDYGSRIVSRAKHSPLNLVGKTTLKQLLALIERSTVVLCPDSGPAHMATAVGTPVIGLYATSNPGRTGPYLSQQWVVNRYPQALANDGGDIDKLRWGTRVRNPDAMKLISVADVSEKLDQVMADKTSRSRHNVMQTRHLD